MVTAIAGTDDEHDDESGKSHAETRREVDPIELLFERPDGSLPVGFVQRMQAVEARQRCTHEEIASIRRLLEKIDSELGRVRNADQLLSEMQTRFAGLFEQSHERDVLNPVFLGLIGIVDRCDEQIRRFDRILQKRSKSGNPSAVAAIQHLLDARQADRAEIEDLLVRLGVEPFQHHGSMFDPARQTCSSTVPCVFPEKHEQIAGRIRPGYQRGQRIVRREFVSVFATKVTQKLQ